MPVAILSLRECALRRNPQQARLPATPGRLRYPRCHRMWSVCVCATFVQRPRAIAKQLFLVNSRKKTNEKTKKSNEKTNNSDKFKRPLPDLYLRPSLRISTAGTSKFPQNSKFQSEARFGFSAKKAVHSDGYRPKIRSICHVTDMKPDLDPKQNPCIVHFESVA